MYALGIDLGTTFTAAATWRDGRAEIAALGSRAAAIPSVVLLRQDETFLTGETANRRALTEPGRVAREFKRRLGDPTPILLGGAPYSAEALTSRLLRSVIDEVSTREGGQPGSICVCHPANWGPYKTDLLRQAVRLASLDQPVAFVTEPEAAAVFYAQQQRIEPGALVAVYDLGGGTFDAAVLRKTRAGFEILGQPEGIERLGGIDFDAAVFNHVSRALGGKLQELDEDEPAAIAAVARLREECTDAKEALSSDTDVTIPVLLPNVSTEVRLTRAELESMVRPALYDTIEALKRALRSAGVRPEDLHSVLLVGGSSRMPIVSQLVGAELGRPVAVDAHPKHAVALGAAWVASAPVAGAPAVAPPAAPPPVTAPPVAAAAPPAASLPFTPPPVPPLGAPAAGSAFLPPLPGGPSRSRMPAGEDAAARTELIAPVTRKDTPARATRDTGPEAPTVRVSRDTPPPVPRYTDPDTTVRVSRDTPPPVPRYTDPEVTVRAPRDVPASAPRPSPRTPVHPPARATAYGRDGGGSRPPRDGGPPRVSRPAGGRRAGRARTVVLAILVLALLGAAGTYAGIALAKRTSATSGSDSTGANVGNLAGGTRAAAATSPARHPSGSSPAASPTVPPDERCTAAIKANKRWVCLTSAVVADGKITISYQADFNGTPPNVHGGFHLHIYGGDGTNPPDSVEGHQSDTPGQWYVEDQNPSVRLLTSDDFTRAVGANAKKVCARIADAQHELVQDNDGTYHTGNCVPILRQ
jgi:molecular chaperone DnaK